MNVLDENIQEDQRQVLRKWRISVKQVGFDLFDKGIKDEHLLDLLRGTKRITFFTRDRRFYDVRFSHPHYALVYLEVEQDDVATFARRLLRHPQFDTHARRMGAVIRVTRSGIFLRRFRQQREAQVSWID